MATIREKDNSLMTFQECYDWFYDAVKRDTYTCNRCGIKAAYTMKTFNKKYKAEFDKRVQEIYDWYVAGNGSKHIRIGDIRRLLDVTMGIEPRWSWFEESFGSYKFKTPYKRYYD